MRLESDLLHEDPETPSRPAAAAKVEVHLTPAAWGWHFWREAECRTAGFAAAQVLPFGSPSLHEAAVACLEAREAAAIAWDRLRETAKARIRELLAAHRHASSEDADPAVSEAELARWRRAMKQAERQQDGGALAECLPADARAQATSTESRRAEAEAAFGSAYSDAAAASRGHAAALAADSRLREAVTWQNRPVLRTALDVLAGPTGAEDNASTRRAALLLASYAQRYSTKNDTIGFFGPVGWARLDDEASGLRLVPGSGLLARRYVYFEDWAIRAYAERLGGDARLRPWRVPRRVPHLRLDGARMLLAGRPVEAGPEEVAVLAACDGQRTARQVAARLSTHPMLDFDLEDDALDLLDRLVARGRVDIRFEVRVGDPHPERHLRAQLLRIDDPALREEVLAGLDALELARSEVAASAGDAERLHAALVRFDADFERLCGIPATRNAGLTYGARTPLYEDCVRDMQLTIGASTREALQAPLSLVLQGARWYCHALGRMVERQLEAVFDSLALGGASSIDMAAFWMHAQDIFFGDALPELEALTTGFCTRWATLLSVDQVDTRRVRCSSSELRERVADLFDAPDCGWASGCHQSPDVMACGSLQELARGDGSFVLGEVHAGINTLMNHSACQQHRDPEALMAALHADLPGGRVIPLLSREGTRQPVRVQVVTDPRRDTELCFSPDARPLAPERSLALSDLVVERSAGVLVARRQDGRRHPLLDVFGEQLSALAATRFKLLPPRAHVPRVTIDRLVVQREAWRFACSSLPITDARDKAQTFLAVTAWRRRNGLPRLVFVKMPWEVKPFYIDLDSPLYVALFDKQVRNALDRGVPPGSEIVVSEMLPTPEELWMTDSDGRRYTSEMRIVAVHQADRGCATKGWQ